MKHKLAVVVPYFGSLPNYFDLWLASAGYNRDIDWLVFTDQPVMTTSSNIRVIPSTLAQVKERLEHATGVTSGLKHPYKLCDFKPAYGEAFSDYLLGYSFWGHADVDVIWGRIRTFVRDDILDVYDRIFGGGHLSFYRNTLENNRTYRMIAKSSPLSYTEVFSNPRSYAFDEWGTDRNGMNAILLDAGIPFYLKTMPYADIKVHPRALRNNREGFGNLDDQAAERKKRKIAYSFQEGILRQHWLDDSGEAQSQEEAYMHLQKRPLNRERLDRGSVNFVLLPPSRLRPLTVPITADFLRRNVKSSGWYGHSYRIRARNVRAKLHRLLDREHI